MFVAPPIETGFVFKASSQLYHCTVGSGIPPMVAVRVTDVFGNTEVAVASAEIVGAEASATMMVATFESVEPLASDTRQK